MIKKSLIIEISLFKFLFLILKRLIRLGLRIIKKKKEFKIIKIDFNNFKIVFNWIFDNKNLFRIKYIFFIFNIKKKSL